MRRFPVALTICAVLAFALLTGLGVWQLRRLAWKEGVITRIEALRNAPPRPIAEVLAATPAAGGAEYQRVKADCAPSAAPAPAAYRYAVRDGEIGWRLLTACRLAAGPYDGVVLDRGLVTRFTGEMAPGVGVYPAPAAVTGVLRLAGAKPLLGPAETAPSAGGRVFRLVDAASLASLGRDGGLARPAPYLLAVETETPAPAGVAPAALPQDIPNNHFVYAMTWFALAGVLVVFYGALLMRRLKVT